MGTYLKIFVALLIAVPVSQAATIWTNTFANVTVRTNLTAAGEAVNTNNYTKRTLLTATSNALASATAAKMDNTRAAVTNAIGVSIDGSGNIVTLGSITSLAPGPTVVTNLVMATNTVSRVQFTDSTGSVQSVTHTGIVLGTGAQAAANTDYLPASPTATALSAIGDISLGAAYILNTNGVPAWLNQRNFIRLYDEFNGVSGIGSLGWLASNGSGGASGAYGAVVDGAIMGAYYTASGTSAGGYGRINGNGNMTYFGNGEVYYETRLRIPVLSTGAEHFESTAGWSDNTTSTNITDGIGFYYSHHINAGKWTAFTYSNTSGTTNTVWAGTTTAGVWYRLSIHINSDASWVKFYVDGTPIATNTTTIPTGSARSTNPQFFSYTHAGTANRYTQIDYVDIKQWLTTAR